MKISFNRTVTNDIDLAMRREWFETNGIGGWAASTIIGLNTRRQHGLLVTSPTTSHGRMVMLSKLDETVISHGRRLELGCNAYPGVIHPNGDQFLESFEREFMPSSTYHAEGIRIQKRVFAVHGEDTVVVLYDVLAANHEFQLELQPFIAGRDAESLVVRNDKVSHAGEFVDGVFRYCPYDGTPVIELRLPGAVFHPRPDWYLSFEFLEDMERMDDFQEDLFSPGLFCVSLQAGSLFGIVATTGNAAAKDPFKLFEREMQRRRSLIQPIARKPAFVKQLTLAADQFILQDGNGNPSISAGYPWTGPDPRMALAALPGLLVTTGRTHMARALLDRHLEAMISNGSTPDLPLWWAVAAYHAWKHLGDPAWAGDGLLPMLNSVIRDFNDHPDLRVNADGMLSSVARARPASWMEIPRKAMLVEINALWINLHDIAAQMASAAGEARASRTLSRTANRLRDRFSELFWNEEARCLVDGVGPDGVDPAIRPNQLLAISLPFPVITGDRAARILDVVDEYLFTPLGLRTLSPQDPGYRPGDRHAGGIVSWLLGPYIDAMKHVRSRGETTSRIGLITKHLKDHLQESGLGTISEGFSGEPPHRPWGNTSHAPSVAACLRALGEERE